MAGWIDNDGNVHIEVEERIDTNANLYKQRAIIALKEKRYQDALTEAQTALKLGYGALEYHVLIARVVFEWGEYPVCLQYIEKNLWDNRDDRSLLPEERNYIYYAYAVCYRECKRPLDHSEFAIVTYDGKGMYVSIEKAIESCTKDQCIVVVDGYYEESATGELNFNSGHTSFKLGQVNISNGNVKLKGTGNASISAQFVISNADVDISDISISNRGLDFESLNFDIVENKGTKELSIVQLVDAKFKVSNVTFINSSSNDKYHISGVTVAGTSVVSVDRSVFRKFNVGIAVSNGEARVSNCEFWGDGMSSSVVPVGAACGSDEMNQPKLFLATSTFHMGSNGLCALAVPRGFIEATDCVFCDSNTGVSVGALDEVGTDAGECVVKNSKILNNQKNIFLNSGRMRIEDSIISGGTGCGVAAMGAARLEMIGCTLQKNRINIHKEGNPVIREIDTRTSGDDPAGSTLESAKKAINLISRFTFGKDIF